MTPVAIGQPRASAVVVGGLASDGAGDQPGMPVEDLQRLVEHPAFRHGVVREEAAGGQPEVFEDVDEVDHDGHLHLAPAGLGLDALDLVVVPVHQDHPGPTVPGIAALGLVEDPTHHRGGVLDHAGDQPLVASCGPRHDLAALLAAGQHVYRRARRGSGVVDAADLGYPLAVALLARRQPGLQRVGGLLGGLGGGGAQRLGPHDDALPSHVRTSTSSGSPAGRACSA